MAEAENLINTLRQTSVPISSKLVRRVVDELERLSNVDKVLVTIRDVCALPAATLEELPGLVEGLLSELADRQIRSDIELVEFVADQGRQQ